MKLIPFIILFFFVVQVNAQISDFKPINFKKSDAVALKYKDEKLINLPELARKLTVGLDTDVEKFRAIFMWVCSNVANDYKLYSKNKRKRNRYKNDSIKLSNWNTKFKKIVFRKLRKSNKTICTGYAFLVKKLANLANIDCKIIHGYARTSTINIKDLDTPNHSWNAVKLNGNWYLCDPTWASGIPDPTTFKFRFQFNEGLFLSDPRIFSINHYPIDEKWLLLDVEKPSYEDFIAAPILYGKAYTHFSVHSTPKKMHNSVQKNENIQFKLQTQDSIKEEDVLFVIETSFNTKKVHPKDVSVKDKLVTINYQFQSTGFYDVHLYIKDDLISTYTFEVTK